MSRQLLSWSALIAILATAVVAPADHASRRTPIVVAVEKARLAVVNIRADRTVLERSSDPFFGTGDDEFDRLFNDFFGSAYGRKTVEVPLGSGVIIDERGLVVTNEHVIHRAAQIRVSLADGKVYDAVLRCADPVNDIALLEIRSDRHFEPIELGISSDLMLGETVIAVGNPFGFENSVATGVVSALQRDLTIGQGRSEREFKGLLQTSALINPGNSGGALLNVDGQLIGLNTAVVSGAQGIGFAIPVDRVTGTLAKLIANPCVTSVWFGADFATPDGREGLLVTAVAPNSPVAKAGLQAGDRVLRLDADALQDEFHLRHQLARLKPGDTVTLRVRGGEQERDALVTLAARPVVPAKRQLRELLQVAVQDVTPSLVRSLQLRVADGVLVSEVMPDGPGAEAGLRSGDVIIQIDTFRVRNIDEAAQALKDAVAGQEITVRVVRGPYLGTTTVTLR